MRYLPILFLLLVSGISAVEDSEKLPVPWLQHNLREYISGVFTTEESPEVYAYIGSISPNPTNKGSVGQSFIPSPEWLGNRIKMSADIMTNEVEGKAYMYIRADAPHGKVVLGRMKDVNKLNGTQSMKTYEIILDIPFETARIDIGFKLHGTGQILFKSLKFEVVDYSNDSTAVEMYKESKGPQSLEFK